MGKKKQSWESPYLGGGKIPAPKQTKSQRQKETERHGLRGCGDPTCPLCNTHIPSGVTGGTRSGRFTTTNYEVSIENTPRGGSINEEKLRRMLERMRSQYDMAFLTPADLMGGAVSDEMIASESRKQPPESYREAREAVKQWIVRDTSGSFDDVIGQDEALEQLKDAIQAPVTQKALYERYGLPMPKGALLTGPPGNGKTMFGRVAANEIKSLYEISDEDYCFLSITGGSLQSPYIGVTEGYIKAMFTFAREYKAYHDVPLLIFIDESDVLLPKRDGGRRVASWEESNVSTFLAEMDGVQESGAFVLLATNRAEKIDSAVLRDGRCDFKVKMKRPDMGAVSEIVLRSFEDCPLAEGETVENLVFAAVESLYSPEHVLMDVARFTIQMKEKGLDVSSDHHRHFLLSDILSGAIAANVPMRAKRVAYARDRREGTVTGVSAMDVAMAVGNLFEENKDLDHEYALAEFTAKADAEIEAKEGSE